MNDMYTKMRQDQRALTVELAASREIGRKLQQLLWKKMPTFESNGFEFIIAFVLF
jgi:hypothetical protein